MANRYQVIIETIFRTHYQAGTREISFERQEIEQTAAQMNIKLPKNIGDVIYSFRYRADLPAFIRQTAPSGQMWIIRPIGRSRYRFVLVRDLPMSPNLSLLEIKIPDATPGIITQYSLSDEQALLAKLRYNRLIDIFTALTCYSLQSHLRTTVPEVGQVETDEVYVGVNRQGVHYVLPVQAKGGSDRLSVIQIEQDIAMCAQKFPALVCRPIGAQFISGDLIALFEYALSEDSVRIASEKHYRLVPPSAITDDDLRMYRSRSDAL